MAETFGIRPWEIELLTPVELQECLDVLKERGTAAQKQAAQQRRRR